MNKQTADRMKSHKKDEFTRADYFRALAFDHLGSSAHDAGMLLENVLNDEVSDAFFDLRSEFHKSAGALFPIHPHGEGQPREDFSRWERGQAWLKSEGIK